MKKITEYFLLSLLSIGLVGCGLSPEPELTPEPINKTFIGNSDIGYITINGLYEDVSGENEYLIYQNRETGVLISMKKYDHVFDSEDIDFLKKTTEKNLKSSFKDDISISVNDFVLLDSVVPGTLIRAISSYKGIDFYMDVYLIHTSTGTVYMSVEGFNTLENIHDLTSDLLSQFVLL